MKWERWKPKLSKAHCRSFQKKKIKTWKAWADSRKYPRFEVGINESGGYGLCSKRGVVHTGPQIEAMKVHAGGFGSIWEMDLEEVDKLILILQAARSELAKLVVKPPVEQLKKKFSVHVPTRDLQPEEEHA